MKLYMPTFVLSGKNCVKEYGKDLAGLGTNAMIITGKHSSRVNGSLEHVINALEENGVNYIIFDDIEENPSVETVMKARKIGIEKKIDFVIGVGGGSAMDASKAIALMIANNERDADALYKNEVLPCLPVAAIPTTAGTGSEVTPYAILTVHEQRTKQSIPHKIFPQLALLDYAYLKTVSRTCLIHTAVDALAHLVESFLNTNSNQFNRIYSEKGLQIWSTIKEELENNTLTDKTYERLMHASMLGGMAIAHTGTSLPHALSYVVTYELDMPHGKAVGTFLAGYVDCYKGKEDVKKVLDLLGFFSSEDFGQYLDRILGNMDISKELNEQTVKAAWSNKAKLANYPYEITYDELIQMYKGVN